MRASPKQPMAEIFGFPADNLSPVADRYRRNRLCPFNNKVPNCTKDKAEDPLGVCSVFEGDRVVVTCPVRFRQDWLIAEDAAGFFFPAGTVWTSLTEVRLQDAAGKSAGNIDVVLVAYDAAGHITDFGSLEIQAVYTSGNIRKAFSYYMEDPAARVTMDWKKQKNYPRPDYLSSSRKRLALQLIYKGGILQAWGKRQAVAVDANFFATLPTMREVASDVAEIAWLVYDMRYLADQSRYQLVHVKTVYSRFSEALETITTAQPGALQPFLDHLQERLAAKRENGGSAAPDASSLSDVIES